MNYHFKSMKSPVGELTLVGSDQGLRAVLWANDELRRTGLQGKLEGTAEGESAELLKEVERQLGDYFAGRLERFRLPLDFVGTEFQRKVWAALLTIPFGETRSYGQIACQIGHPQAVRAVGAANGKNPISIIAPCHRVIGANGKLTGFAGGLEAKALLLDLESGVRRLGFR